MGNPVSAKTQMSSSHLPVPGLCSGETETDPALRKLGVLGGDRQGGRQLRPDGWSICKAILA